MAGSDSVCYTVFMPRTRQEMREYSRARRAANPGEAQRYQRKRSFLFKMRCLDIARTSKCSCGESHPAALQFHHRDPTTKLFTIGNAYSRYKSDEELENEIAKCDVLCGNCHRILHADWDEFLGR